MTREVYDDPEHGTGAVQAYYDLMARLAPNPSPTGPPRSLQWAPAVADRPENQVV